MRPHAPGQQAGNHPVPAYTYIHTYTQSVTTPRRRGRKGEHEAPRELTAHRAIGIAADQVESNVSGAARGWAVGGGSAIQQRAGG